MYFINEIINLNCENVYQILQDSGIERVRKKFQNCEYYNLFSQFCKTAPSVDKYKNEKLLDVQIAYEANQLVNSIVKRSETALIEIQNEKLFYDLFTNIICLMRPLRKRINAYITNTLKPKIMRKFKIYIFFYIFNFIYEIGILLFLKIIVINSNLMLTKEIIGVAKAFECV